MDTTTSKDFFISYNSKDEDTATWIAQTLEDAGYSTIIQAWDFPPGSNFVLEMDKALQKCDRVIAVLSNNYFGSNYTPSEWAEAFRLDPKGEQRKLIPVFIEKNLSVSGLLGPIVGIKLADLLDNKTPANLEKAKERLINGIQAPERKSRLTADDNSKQTLKILIGSDGTIISTPESLIEVSNWLANGGQTDVDISIIDAMTPQYEADAIAAEKAIKESSDHSNALILSKRLMSVRQELHRITFRNEQLKRVLLLFISLNYEYQYIRFDSPVDFFSFVQTLRTFILDGKSPRKNNSKYIDVDFTLIDGPHRGYYFVVPIKEVALLKAGLSNNMGFADIALLDYGRFDKETQKEILAEFCIDLELMSLQYDKPYFEDAKARCLFCYNLGLH